MSSIYHLQTLKNSRSVTDCYWQRRSSNRKNSLKFMFQVKIIIDLFAFLLSSPPRRARFDDLTMLHNEVTMTLRCYTTKVYDDNRSKTVQRNRTVYCVHYNFKKISSFSNKFTEFESQ